MVGENGKDIERDFSSNARQTRCIIEVTNLPAKKMEFYLAQFACLKSVNIVLIPNDLLHVKSSYDEEKVIECTSSTKSSYSYRKK